VTLPARPALARALARAAPLLPLRPTRPRLALFDLDHTLLPIDSDYEWGEFTTTIGWTDPVEFARRNDEFYAHYQAGTLDIHDYVRFATEAIRLPGARGRPCGGACADFMRTVCSPPSARGPALVRQHQAGGRRGGDHHRHQRIRHPPDCPGLWRGGTDRRELERGGGRLDHRRDQGRAVGARRQGGAHGQWLAARGLDWADVHSTFYTDSINDLPLLEKVNHPGGHQPRRPLRAMAPGARMAHTGPVLTKNP
jgi:phosphoserine phosphatase